ncbi:MAG: ABC transporter permease [Eubacteriales bacterium]|nr:ABC transporter permease [Eubacteriales bacterium]
MQTIKTMFRSPRFVVGLIMVLTIVCYALFIPMIFTADPKESRAESPYYTEYEDLHAALLAEDDAAIETEMAELKALADANDDPILADAANNIYETLEAVSGALAKNPADDAISALDQVKSNRKYPLVNVERDVMRALLEEGKVDEAIVEGEAVIAHCEAAAAFAQELTAAGADFAAVQAVIDGFTVLNPEETVDILAAVQASDAEALAEAIDDFAAQHAKLGEYVAVAIERVNGSVYAAAAQAGSTKIQKTYLIPKNTAPNERFWFGTDNFSRDLFLEMAYGARTSLMVGLIAGVLATIIGLALGLTAGFVGGMVDNIITLITNTFIVIPSTVILILISIAVGQFREAWITGVIIGLIAWPWTARAVRAQTTSLRFRDHVNMARITGYSTARIIVTEIMPYLASYIVMAFILQVAGGIGQEATLALLGLGDPTGISLGRLMNWAMEYEAINFNRWWLFIPVACAIAMITYGLYLMNSGMDQVFNPKIRS